MSTTNYSLERGLPASIDAERSILGAILLDPFAYTQAAEKNLRPEDFSLDSHRRIYARMFELAEASKAIDLITLAEELGRNKEIEAIGGVAYLSSLTDGLPHRPNIESYVAIVKDKSLARGIIFAANSAIAAAMDESTSGAEVLESVESSIYALGESATTQTFKTPKQIFQATYADLSDFASPDKHPGIKTGFCDLDMLITMRPGDLIIIAGRPSMGKTAIAMNIGEKQAIDRKRVVGAFSLETSADAILMRLACSMAKVNSTTLREGFTTEGERERVFAALGKLFESSLFVDDSTGATVSQMRAKARRLKHQQKRLDLLIIDHIQLMADKGQKHQNRTSEVTAITRGLKLMAKELEVPVIALSQLNRGTEQGGENEPSLKHLRESGSIEQDADIVAFIHRPEYYDRGNPEIKNKANILVKKNRDGACDTVELVFLHEYARFENLAREVQE